MESILSIIASIVTIIGAGITVKSALYIKKNLKINNNAKNVSAGRDFNQIGNNNSEGKRQNG